MVQAQKHGAAAQDVAGDRLASAKAQAQDYAQAAQQRAAEHLDRVSPLSLKAASISMLQGGMHGYCMHLVQRAGESDE